MNQTEKSGISYFKSSLIFACLSLPIIIYLVFILVLTIIYNILGPGGWDPSLQLFAWLFFFSFLVIPPIFTIQSMVKFYKGHNEFFLMWNKIEIKEDKWVPIIKKYKQIIKIIIINLISSSFIIIFLFGLFIIGFFISLFLNIVYLILSINYKKKISIIWKYLDKLNKKFPQLKTQFQEVETFINQNEFDKAGKLLSELKSQAKSLHIKSFSDKKYFIDFDQLNKNLIRSEEQYKLRQKIHTSLLMFSKKYPRILLKELADDVKMDQYQVERITKQFIKDNLIPAKYDEESKAIEFTFLEEEIDDLMKRFEEWEQAGEGKKI
ncbi:MAG: PCI domain-containing protein [Promethearchaeota archaeon]